MKRFLSVLMIFALLAIATTNICAEEKKIRVLLTFGGHGFQQEPFFKMFDEMEGIEYTKAPLPQSADKLKPGLEKEIDVIVMYDMAKKFTPQQQEAFVELLGKGIGVVSLHHNMGAHREWDEFRKIIGAKYLFKPEKIDGKDCGKSNYAHGQDLKVTIADKDHPITKGLDDFEIHDETYGNYWTNPDAKILITTDHPKNDPELAWVQKYANSPVFYFMLGHDAKAWANPAFPEIVKRGIHWAAAENAKK